MIPLRPFSVKFPPEVRSQITEAAGDVGYSENQVIVESVRSVLGMIGQINAEILPRVVVLIRAAREHSRSPQKLGKKSQTPLEQKTGGQAKKSKRKTPSNP